VVTLFWICLGLIGYAYLGYPLFITIIGSLRRQNVHKDSGFLPTVTYIIPAHNEERVIRRKLENTLSLDYPSELLSILVVSDASTDKTDEIVREFAERGVDLLRLNERGGKSRALNISIPASTGKIVVLCDANVMFDTKALRYMIRNFADPQVGCVCGRKTYLARSSMATAKGERLYWRLEEYLKRCESLSGSVAGADGAIYAIRRELYVPFDEDLIDDMLISLNVFAKGYRLVAEPNARAFEYTTTRAKEEYARKSRIVATAIRTLARNVGFLNPFTSGLMAWRIFSHKVIRWMVPFFLIGLVVSLLSLLLDGRFVLVSGAAGVFLLLALIGGLLQRAGKRSKVLSLPYYFVLVNTAALVGWWRFLTGRIEKAWEKPESSRF
jgi:cellulose synthase/poly-beta-1,6-N-acetylglucosamine synthase-like glycosyltransferase